ncbi:hypothetical protein AAFZ73_18090, partial [Acinetobacter baumannii]|uniref:hypothetical protein n=1 Tax=Acinetobacter baumannii TaxID=470 RepID=UPI001C09FD28
YFPIPFFCIIVLCSIVSLPAHPSQIADLTSNWSVIRAAENGRLLPVAYAKCSPKNGGFLHYLK